MERDLNAFLTEMEGLSFKARFRRMVEIGKKAQTEGEAGAQIDTLERGGFYQRQLALQSCYGSRDGARVLRALQAESRQLRGFALTLVPLACDDGQVALALESLPLSSRQTLLFTLRKAGRTAPVDAFLTRLAVIKDESLCRLAHYGSALVTAALLTEILPQAGLQDWRRLAAWQPDLAAQTLQAEGDSVREYDPELMRRANVCLPLLATHRPDEALTLVKSLVRHIPPGALELGRLVKRRPAEIADLLLALNDRTPFDYAPLLSSLSAEQADRLLASGLAECGSTPAFWLKRLPSARRGDLYARFGSGWRDREGLLATGIVALLPRAEREAEAQRHVALPFLATRPLLRLPYMTFLPWETALEGLRPFLDNPDAYLRGAAYRALIGAVRYHRSHLGEVLDRLRARRNEQDPVRQAMLTTLADLPPGLFQSEHLDALAQIVQDTLNAVDLSYQTGAALQSRLMTLLPFYPTWIASQLSEALSRLGHLQFFQLETKLSDAQVRRLAPELTPVLRAWQTRERENALLSFAQALGRRLRAFQELVEILERVLQVIRNAHVASSMLNLIATYFPDRAAELIPALLEADPSWFTQAPVYDHLHLRRQDLLTPFLGQKAYKGRFSTGKTRFALPVSDGFHRWTPMQQNLFADTLQRLIEDIRQTNYTCASAIDRLAKLPETAPTYLMYLASLADPKQALLRDSALRALARRDDGASVPFLLAALEDDRARIAIYALREAVLEMPAERAVPLLMQAPRSKVTVAKEIVRLLGDLKSEAAYAALLEMSREESLHRDIRAALLRALWEYLEREETWALVAQYAASDDSALAIGVSRIPADRLSPTARAKLIDQLALTLNHPDPLVRMSALERCTARPLANPERSLLRRLGERLNSTLPGERAAAAWALLSSCSAGDAEAIGRILDDLTPNRRAIQHFVSALAVLMPANRRRLTPIAQATLAALASDPCLAPQRLSVACAALSWSELTDLLRRLAQSQELHPDGFAIADAALRRSDRPDTEEMESLERALGAEADPLLRRLGLAALIGLSQPPRGWNDTLRQRLEVYRADPAPLVRGAAQFTFPAE